MSVIPATIAAVEARTPDISVLHLIPQTPLVFDAGQYVSVTATGFDTRPFSIANAPRRDGGITLHVRNMGQGLSQYLCADATIGDLVQIGGPYGQMHSENARARPVLLIGGGTGVVPLLAIAEDIVRKGLSEDGITLIYGVRLEDDIHCARELEVLAASGELTVHKAIGAETPDKVLSRLAPKLAGHAVYISGPDPMLFNIMPTLRQHGLEEAHLHTDANLSVLTGVLS